MEKVYCRILKDRNIKMNILHYYSSVFSENERTRFTEEYFDKICQNAIFLIAQNKEDICGYCAFYANDYIEKTAYITSLAIAQAHQGKGIANALLQMTEKISHKVGMNAIKLEVSMSNYKALQLYKKNGFSPYKKLDNSQLMIKKIADH